MYAGKLRKKSCRISAAAAIQNHPHRSAFHARNPPKMIAAVKNRTIDQDRSSPCIVTQSMGTAQRPVSQAVMACPLSCSAIASMLAATRKLVPATKRATTNATGSASSRYFNSVAASFRIVAGDLSASGDRALSRDATKDETTAAATLSTAGFAGTAASGRFATAPESP